MTDPKSLSLSINDLVKCFLILDDPTELVIEFFGRPTILGISESSKRQQEKC
jgi:hypothetical protein